ncbi:hypothetical protein [Chryseobacterium sp. MEBOG07]|uniref:hypothetical protein n=1 Tax=Chryseobacterium sp. MEBOG07 TaxID=2879939 RepID=UPI001F1FF650|nr:hypothetical protein [Chryseobacterium sp. MEBOG07]UKB80862.1 hypothetical protein LF886_07685 [Chryseobacterium sp. MEBOG07]
MIINFKHALSQKSIYITALSACLIAVAAFAVLSLLITEDSRKNTDDFAKKTFFRKYESIEHEFRNIEDYQYLLRALIQKDGLKNYKDYSLVLNDLNKKETCCLTAGIITRILFQESRRAIILCPIFSRIRTIKKNPLLLKIMVRGISKIF